MKNVNYLYEQNKGNYKLTHLQGKNLFYNSNAETFNFNELKKLINFFAEAENKYRNANIRYVIQYNKDIIFDDKLSIVLLECLFYHLIINMHRNIKLNANIKKSITSELFGYSCIWKMSNVEEFVKNFKFDIYEGHFRRLACVESLKSNPQELSVIMGDIQSFLTNCGIEKSKSCMISEISSELMDNALEHSESDCLIDIDVTKNPYIKDGNLNKLYFGVNIVVVDFSNKILGEDIGLLLSNSEIKGEQYTKLENFNTLHKSFFNEDYKQEQFYMLSSFQNKITGRSEKSLTGGKGLTKLIEGLQKSAEAYNCYVVSNGTIINFIKEFIKQDEEKWVGFNINNDFKFPPDKISINKSPLNIFGTAYNLNFVFEKGE